MGCLLHPQLGSRKAGLLSRPWFFGPDFRKPSDSELQAAAGENDKAYAPAELRGEDRPEACDKSALGLLFRTRNGLPYSRHALSEGDAPTDSATAYDGIGNRWHKLTGKPFSGLRATFATAADDFPDQRAVDVVMGHRSHESIRSRHYARRFEVERIRKLVEHVRP